LVIVVVLLHVDDVVLVYVDVVFPRPDVSLSFPIPLPDVINLTLLHKFIIDSCHDAVCDGWLMKYSWVYLNFRCFLLGYRLFVEWKLRSDWFDPRSYQGPRNST
ncbi:unnamed protein product, partial [Rotaria socialis]